MVSLYSALFICVCISLLLHSHIAKYYATTAYASHENSKGTDFITTLAVSLQSAHLTLYVITPYTISHHILYIQGYFASSF